MTDELKEITNFDRLIHAPSRLAIMAVLSACESADFTFLLNTTDLSKGNLSAHLSKLRDAGYVRITKSFRGNYPHTTCALTKEGRRAFDDYRKQYLALAKQLQKWG
jgi:DNA-binding transcriptional ArsR family regulator